MAALTFPLSLAGFWSKLRAVQTRFTLGEAFTTSETGGGEIITARRGMRLWSGSITVMPAPGLDQDGFVALVDVIRQAGASILVHDRKHPFPKFDPNGSVINSAVPSINSIASNRRIMTVTALPNGYVLSAGDMLSITYGSAPIRYYLGRIAVGATMAGNAEIEVVPPLPAGITTGASLSFKKPVCKAVYVPHSYQDPLRTGSLDTGFSFDWKQTIR